MRRISIKGLNIGVTGLQEKVSKARAAYDKWKARIKELDGQEAKQTYVPAKIVALKSEARAGALKEVRGLKEEMTTLAGPALGQRRLWSKAAMLRDTKFSEVPDYLRGDRGAVVQYELLHATKELALSTRAARLSNESLLEAIETAVACDELATVAILVTEAELRGDGRLKLQVNEAIRSIQFPEVQEAEECFNSMERSLAEVSALEGELVDPLSQSAKATAQFFQFNRQTDEPDAA